MHRFDTPTPPRLTIEFRAGTVDIDTADVAETTVDLQPRHDSKATREAMAATVIEQRGDEIFVLVPTRLGGLFGRSTDLALTVTAPHGTALRASSGSADIVATGRFATTTVTTGSGDVELGDVEDSARLRSGSGRLRVASIAKDAHVVTGSGDIDLGVLTGSGVVHSGSGDVRIGSGGAALGGQDRQRRRVDRHGAGRRERAHRVRRHLHRGRHDRRGAGQGGVRRHPRRRPLRYGGLARRPHDQWPRDERPGVRR